MVYGDRMNTKMKQMNPAGRFFRNHWLMGLIILQPILDIIAFWTKSPDGTFAGFVRLLVMLAFPITLLIILRERKDKVRLALGLCAVGVICLLHLANVYRIGAADLRYEIAYTAKVAHMPVLALCFVFSIRDAQTRNQAYWGLFFAAGITALALLLSIVTGTANITYGEGLGVSGWVIDDNRTANSTILVVLSAFAVFCAVKSDKKTVNLLVPVLSAVCLIINAPAGASRARLRVQPFCGACAGCRIASVCGGLSADAQVQDPAGAECLHGKNRGRVCRGCGQMGL